MKNKVGKTGFTIIEVALVLAIAGLIFIMVFLGLPALQRAQRNEERKRTAGQVAAWVLQYHANNRGNFPPVTRGVIEVGSTRDTLSKSMGLDGIIDEYSINDVRISPCAGQSSCGYASSAPSPRFSMINILLGGVCAPHASRSGSGQVATAWWLQDGGSGVFAPRNPAMEGRVAVMVSLEGVKDNAIFYCQEVSL